MRNHQAMGRGQERNVTTVVLTQHSKLTLPQIEEGVAQDEKLLNKTSGRRADQHSRALDVRVLSLAYDNDEPSAEG